MDFDDKHFIPVWRMQKDVHKDDGNVERYDFYDKTPDYVLYRCFVCCADLINKYQLEGSVAEAGVYKGGFATKINFVFPDKKLYLYDTFTGFSDEDLIHDVDSGFLEKDSYADFDYFNHGDTAIIDKIKAELHKPENVFFRKGIFPDTIGQEECDEKFCFVRLDMDLYRPTLAGLKFFYPKMVSGGYIFIHDYDSIPMQQAVADFEKEFGPVCKVPICDKCESLIIVKGY